MKKNSLFDLNRQLNALSVFRSILETDIVSSLQKLLNAVEKSSLDEQLLCYGAFSNALYRQGGNLSQFVKNFVLGDENFYLEKKLHREKIPSVIEESLQRELQLLKKLSALLEL